MKVIIPADRAETFQQIFGNIKLLTQTITIYFEESRLFMQTMDSSHVSIVECVLPASWFALYSLESAAFSIGLDVVLFSKILSTRDRGMQQGIVLQMDEQREHLTIYMTSGGVNNSGGDATLINKEFDMPLIELDSDLLDIPEIDYDVEMSLQSADFAELIHQLRIFGDTLDMECSETNIAMNSISHDKGRMRSRIDIDRLTSFAINEGETIRISFSLRYLNDICAFHKLSATVDLKLQAESPLRVTYGLQSEDAYVRFYLAPKISDNEED